MPLLYVEEPTRLNHLLCLDIAKVGQSFETTKILGEFLSGGGQKILL